MAREETSTWWRDKPEKNYRQILFEYEKKVNSQREIRLHKAIKDKKERERQGIDISQAHPKVNPWVLPIDPS